MILQILVLLPHVARPPECIGEQAREHGLRWEVVGRPMGVDGLAAKGRHGSFEPKAEPALHPVPTRIDAPAQDARLATDTSSAPGTSLPKRLMARLASLLP